MRNKFWILGAAVLVTSQMAVATVHTTDNGIDSSQYGHLDQNHESVNFGPTACGPTAVANSFQMLANEYGLTGLMAADPYQTINDLETYMDTSDNGTDIDKLITGKRDYIHDKGLSDKISIEGETFFNLGIEGVADNTKPTWDFLFDQIQKGQDVEVLINWWDGTKYNGGHYITVTGMTYDDVLDTGTLNAVDPWGGVDISGTIADHNGFMQLTYSGGAAADPNDPDNPEHLSSADISGVVAESPVPEPATVGIIAGAFMLGSLRRSRREA